MKLIFWDYDGTIVNTEVVYRQSLISFFQSNNLLNKEITKECFYKYIAGKHPEEFVSILQKDGYVKDVDINLNDIKDYYRYYFNHLKYKEIQIVDGLDILIKKLSEQKNTIMSIVSSSWLIDYNIKSKNANNKILNNIFDINKNIYLAGEIENCRFKPEPDCYIYAFKDVIDKNNISIQKEDEVFIVEDSIAGCQAGASFKALNKDKINITIIGFLGGTEIDNSKILLSNCADIIAHNTQELERIIY